MTAKLIGLFDVCTSCSLFTNLFSRYRIHLKLCAKAKWTSFIGSQCSAAEALENARSVVAAFMKTNALNFIVVVVSRAGGRLMRLQLGM